MENVKPVMESYFGKTPVLLECETVLEEMINILKKNPYANIINSPLNTQLQRLLEKQFGFKKVCINWLVSNGIDLLSTKKTVFATPETGSLVSSIILFDKNHGLDRLENGKKEYYDKDHKHVLSITISILFVLNNELTAGELLAVILHETGHNFDKSPYAYMNALLYYLKIYQDTLIYSSVLNYVKEFSIETFDQLKDFLHNTRVYISRFVGRSNLLKNITYEFNKKWETLTSKIPHFKQVELICQQAHNFYTMYSYGKNIINFKYLIKDAYSLSSENVGRWFANAITRKKEKFADSFAVAYGYSAELTSFQLKCELDFTHPIKNVKELTFLRDIMITAAMIHNSFIDPSHGSGIERAKNNIKVMRKELSTSGLQPEVRKMLENDISECEQMISDWLYKSESEKLVISGFYQKFLINVFGSDAFLIEKIFPDFRA